MEFGVSWDCHKTTKRTMVLIWCPVWSPPDPRYRRNAGNARKESIKKKPADDESQVSWIIHVWLVSSHFGVRAPNCLKSVDIWIWKLIARSSWISTPIQRWSQSTQVDEAWARCRWCPRWRHGFLIPPKSMVLNLLWDEGWLHASAYLTPRKNPDAEGSKMICNPTSHSRIGRRKIVCSKDPSSR